MGTLRSLDTFEANWLLYGEIPFWSFFSPIFYRVCCYNGISLCSVMILLFSTFLAVERIDTFETLRTRTRALSWVGLSLGAMFCVEDEFLNSPSRMFLLPFIPKLVVSSSYSTGLIILRTFCRKYDSLSGETTSGRVASGLWILVTPRLYDVNWSFGE